jgi:Bacterial HORMA domain family 1
MVSTSTTTTTYSIADIEIVMRRVTSDLIMIASSTRAITESKAREYGHDIELLGAKGYLQSVDVTLLNGGKEIKAIRFDVNLSAEGLTMSRPGGVLWPVVETPYLRIVLSYTSQYTPEAKEYMRKKLKISWTLTSADISHMTLKMSAGRDYVSNSYGVQRKDFST